MKNFLTVAAIFVLSQVVNAQSWQYMPDNLTLVQENLNKDLYTFQDAIVNFSISKNREVARLQILNNICPKVAGGFSCFAMPSVVLNATYTLKLAKIDSCGVQTLVSNSVEVGSRFIKDQRRFTQVRIRDYSRSNCEMVYLADVQVDLKDTMVNTSSGKVEVHYSSMQFSFDKNFGPVNQ